MRSVVISIDRRTPCMALVELDAGIPAAFTRPILGVVVKVVFSLFCRICCQRRHCCGSAPILCVFVCVCACCVCVFIYLFIQYLFPPSVQLSQGCGCSFLAVPLVEGFYQLNYSFRCCLLYRYHCTKSFNSEGIKCPHH